MSAASLASIRPSISVGSKVGAYRLIERLGEGGMGEVFLAVHEHLERRVALKLLHVDRSRDAHHIERFVREAWMANKVRHENVVDVTDLAFLPDGRPYVVMEYIEGGTLYTLWDEANGLDIVRFLDACIQVASALSAAHRASIVHRDVKPANIFLTPRGVKIADFGLSKLLANTGRDDQFTASGIVLATPPYMSPEQATGEPIDGRSDIYSVGIMMWEMLVGRRPFRANAFGEYVLMHATRAVEPPSAAGASMVPGGIPPALDAIILRCLAKKREERYASAEELRAALAGVRDSITGEAPVRARSPKVRSARLQRAGLAVAGALGVVALVVMAARGKSPEPAPAAPAVPSLVITASGLEPKKPEPMKLPVDIVEPPKPVKMEGLGLKISAPKPQPPRKHKDSVDPHALKDPFGGE
jgi:serine/threonine-protein kinase